MAKKTKKEKIIADLRRKLRFTDYSLETPATEKITKETSQNTPLPSPSNSPPPIQTQSLYIYPLQLIRKDLTKTLLLSILTISLEIALFLILEKHLILPFRIKF